MKKVLIVTIFGYENFGNRLQNYAVHRLFSKLGYDVHTYGKYPVKRNRAQTFLYYIKSITKTLLYKANLFTSKYTYNAKWYLEKDRIRKFIEFNNKFIKVDFHTSRSRLKNEYDYFVLGSDQVWNPNWITKNNKNLYDLSFCDRQKRVCLCPSFGVERIPEKSEEYFKKTLNNFEYLSVREQEGVKIIHKLADKHAELLLDPTMMLNKDEWSLIAQQPNNITMNKPYILCYFVGSISSYNKEFVNKIAEKNKLTVINIFVDKDSDYYYCGPSEFVYLIKEASLIITDSFHGSVFSVIFDKPFVVFYRDDGNGNIMNSRINTLLNKLSLSNRFYKAINEENIFDNDYAEAKKIIKNEQTKCINYLNTCLNS